MFLVAPSHFASLNHHTQCNETEYVERLVEKREVKAEGRCPPLLRPLFIFWAGQPFKLHLWV